MARKTAPISTKMEKILKDIGKNIQNARLRRRWTSEMLAERAGMSRPTLRRIENGESGVTIGAYASVLFVLGLENDLLLIAKDDPLGRKLQDAGLKHTKHRVPKKGKK